MVWFGRCFPVVNLFKTISACRNTQNSNTSTDKERKDLTAYIIMVTSRKYFPFRTILHIPATLDNKDYGLHAAPRQVILRPCARKSNIRVLNYFALRQVFQFQYVKCMYQNSENPYPVADLGISQRRGLESGKSNSQLEKNRFLASNLHARAKENEHRCTISTVTGCF